MMINVFYAFQVISVY